MNKLPRSGSFVALAGAAVLILSARGALAQETEKKPKVVDMGSYKVVEPPGGWDISVDKKEGLVSFKKAKGTGALSQMFPALGPRARETSIYVFAETAWPNRWLMSEEQAAKATIDEYTWESEVDVRGLEAITRRAVVDRQGKTLHFAAWKGPRFIRPGKKEPYGLDYFIYLYFPPDFKGTHRLFHFQLVAYRPEITPEQSSDPLFEHVLSVIDSLEIVDPLQAVPGPYGELLRAAAAGETEGVLRAIDKGADPKAAGPRRGALSVAAGSGRREVVDRLIELGAPIDAPDESGGMTPLLAAVWGCEPGIAARLVEKGADVNRRIDALTRAGVSPLMLAASAGDPELVRALLEAGADVEARTDLGETALALACTFDSRACVALLAEKGADVNARMSDGQTPLMRAADYDRAEIVKILLENKADPNAKEAERGWTAAMMTVRNDNPDILRLLIDHGADVNIPETGEAVTALNGAVLMNRPKIAALLLEAGADVNRKMKDGRTALIAATEIGSLDMVKLLVEKGADLSAMNAKGQTALKIAAKRKETKIIEVLKAAGAK